MKHFYQLNEMDVDTRMDAKKKGADKLDIQIKAKGKDFTVTCVDEKDRAEWAKALTEYIDKAKNADVRTRARIVARVSRPVGSLAQLLFVCHSPRRSRLRRSTAASRKPSARTPKWLPCSVYRSIACQLRCCALAAAMRFSASQLCLARFSLGFINSCLTGSVSSVQILSFLRSN
jgi:hypothetical protein